MLGRPCSALFVRAAEQKTRPNVILVITDDQGYGDLGVHSYEIIKTTNIAGLASESVRLTDFHVDPTCSPTRVETLQSAIHSCIEGLYNVALTNALKEIVD